MPDHQLLSRRESAPRLVSIKQTAFALGIGRTLTYELISLGKLKAVRIGRRRFVPAESIDEFLVSLSAQVRS
jgi:excisionase family DNA binding protein